jgi:hypothetical protein
VARLSVHRARGWKCLFVMHSISAGRLLVGNCGGAGSSQPIHPDGLAGSRRDPETE